MVIIVANATLSVPDFGMYVFFGFLFEYKYVCIECR